MGCLFRDFPKHPLPKSSIFVYILVDHLCVQLCNIHLPIVHHFTRQCTAYKFDPIILMTLWILLHPCNIYEQDSENNLPARSLARHTESQTAKTHTISFSNSLGCRDCYTLIRSSIQDPTHTQRADTYNQTEKCTPVQLQTRCRDFCLIVISRPKKDTSFLHVRVVVSRSNVLLLF